MERLFEIWQRGGMHAAWDYAKTLSVGRGDFTNFAFITRCQKKPNRNSDYGINHPMFRIGEKR